jgi:hypothetical protein
MKSRIDDRQGNQSYIQGAFGGKNSEEIAQLFAPKSIASSRGNMSLIIPSRDYQPRRPTMSSAIIPTAYERSTYESEPDLDTGGELESGYNDEFYSVNPGLSHSGTELGYAVQGIPAASTDSFEGEAKTLAKAKSSQQAYRKRNVSYTADDFVSPSSSPPIASTPTQSSLQDSRPLASSTENFHSLENTPGFQQASSSKPPENKRKLPGLLRRKLANSSAQRKAETSSSLSDNTVSSATGLPVASALDIARNLLSTSNTGSVVPPNTKNPERRDEYGHVLPVQDDYAFGGSH